MIDPSDTEDKGIGNPVGVSETEHGLPANSQLVARLRRCLPHLFHNQPVSLAYLYGSAATGQQHPFSDIDIALVLLKDLAPLERLKLILRLQVDLADECGISNADVRIIDDAPLVLRGKVVCNGILVYARDERERVEFETYTRLRYFDYLPLHRRLQDAFFADLKERGLHG